MVLPYCCQNLRDGLVRSLLAGYDFAVCLWCGCCSVIKLLYSMLQDLHLHYRLQCEGCFLLGKRLCWFFIALQLVSRLWESLSADTDAPWHIYKPFFFCVYFLRSLWNWWPKNEGNLNTIVAQLTREGRVMARPLKNNTLSCQYASVSAPGHRVLFPFRQTST